jgi:riboflavin kinase/FMN adenylyltransferase
MVTHIYDVKDCPQIEMPSVVGIGVFDGVHLGHQKIIQQISQAARQAQLLSIILTFDPHPDEFFSQKPIPLIQTLDQRINTLQAAGIQRIIVVRFNHHFAFLPAEDFLRRIILGCLKARLIIIGENFRFGHQRQGTPELLQKWGPKLGFATRIVPSLRADGQTISSSLIRELLRQGRIEEANHLLGRPYSIEGMVTTGQARGKQLGFPTANLESPNHLLCQGVFISVVEWGDRKWPALTNIGRCPTFKQEKTQVECHLLHFQGHLYGEKLKIYFYHKLRDEKQFPSARALTDQIKKDRQQAEDYFHHHQVLEKNNPSSKKK